MKTKCEVMKYLKLFAGLLLLILLLSGYDHSFRNERYGFDKIIIFITFVVSTYEYYKIKKEKLAVLFGAIVIVFQPFLTIELSYHDWFYLELFIAFMLLIIWGHENGYIKKIRDKIKN